MNSEFYDSDGERWDEIAKGKMEVAEHLRVPQRSVVLDVLVGEGDFARAVAESSWGTIVAGEILASDLKEAKRRVERDKLKQRVELLRMDVKRMAFMKDSFDYIVNFSGLEDFTAVSGEEHIERVFDEMTRVLKTNGVLAFTFIPAIEPRDDVSGNDAELQEYMYEREETEVFS